MKRKSKGKLIAEIVKRLPREISRAVWFFINHGGSLTGAILDSKYYPSPIALRGLELLVKSVFKIDVKKSALLQRWKEVYEDDEDELEVVFADDIRSA